MELHGTETRFQLQVVVADPHGRRLNRSSTCALDGKLVPEAVAFRGLTVGRFEITRAQFAEFDCDYQASAGQENFPAGGISFEQAKAYCEWFAKLTGQPWRLPTEAEAEKL